MTNELMMSEAVMIKKCVHGDKKSQKLLYEIYATKMRYVCARYAKNDMDAEDIVQEGFIKLFNNIEKFRGEGSFEGWVRRIFINVAIGHIKGKKLNIVEIGGLENLLVANNATVLDTLYEKDILRISNTMSNGFKTVFRLYAVDGFTHKEVGHHLGIAESTSKSQYTRAKVKLKHIIRSQV